MKRLGEVAGEHQQVLNRAGFLVGLGAGIGTALAGYAYLREPFDVRLDQVQIQLPRARQRLPERGLRLLHLSDSHFRGAQRREREKIARVRRAVADLAIDIIVHTGDFLHDDSGLENVLALMDVLPTPRLGAYAVLGNHDYAVYNMGKSLWYTWRNFVARESRTRNVAPPSLQRDRRQRLRQYGRFLRHLIHNRIDGERCGSNDVERLQYELERQGIQVLRNRAVHLNSQSDLDIFLAGVDDVHEGEPDLAAALGGVPDGAPVVLLSHNPDILDTPAVSRTDLVLAGHTHGGQIVLPVVGPAYTQSLHLARREASGYFRRGRTHVFINRGLGEGIPLRFGAPPHLTLITLRGE